MDQPSVPIQPKKSTNVVMWVILLIIVLAGVGVFLFLNQDNVNDNTANVNTRTNINSTVGTNTVTNNNSTASVNSATNTNTSGGLTARSVPYVTADFQFQPPANLYIVLRNGSTHATEFNTVANNPQGNYSNTFLIIKVDDQPPAQVDGVDILLDTKPTSTTKVDGHNTNVYSFPVGYEGTPPFIVYRIQLNNTYYRLEFWNTSEATDDISAVLNSFQFTK